MNKYVIDSSSLIDLERYYPLEIFPSVWEYLFELFNLGILFSVNEVYEELKDSQKLWQQYKNSFRELTDEETEYLSEIMSSDKFSDFINNGISKTNGGPWADPYLVACGIADENVSVISQESSKNHPKTSIPYVCGEYNISCIKFLDFLKLMDFKL